jgi:capsular exopolysaccharide synthesis family protein
VDLLGAIAMLRRRFLAIVLCLLAGAAGGYDLGHHGQKHYESTAQVLVNVPAAGTASEQLAGVQLSSGLVATYAGLVKTQLLYDRVVETLRKQGFGQPGAMSASLVAGTFLINITGNDTVPAVAQATANAAAKALSEEVAELQSGLPNPISVHLVSVGGPPGGPVSPNPRLDLIVGIILGAVAGLALALLLEALDRTVKSVSQADAAVAAPMLGIVPKRRGKTLAVGARDEGVAGEPYRSLRASLRFLEPDRPLRSVLMTSPSEGEGKTTTAANLAIALALSGERTVAVDADLRRGGLSRAFGLDRSVGLTSVVMGKTSLEDALQEWAPNLKVLATGPLPPNPSEILGSQLTNELLRRLEHMADIVVIDTTPVLPVADALALGTQVDGVLLVLRHSRTPRNAAVAARRRLESIGARALGYVLNGAPDSATRGYYLDYTYRAAPDSPVAGAPGAHHRDSN